MSCTVPITTSPGSLFLAYIHSGGTQVHHISWGLIAGVDISTTTFLRTEAHRLGDLLVECLPAVARITDWGIRTPDGGTYFTEPWGSGGIGTHTSSAQMQPWFSTTVAFVGTAQAPTPGTCHGRLISRLHTYGALSFTPGMKEYDASLDAAYLAFIVTGLNASTYLPADKYGQQGTIEQSMPVQWNAYTQRKEGS